MSYQLWRYDLFLIVMSNNFIFRGADKFNIENQLSTFYDLITNRLLPSFSSLEDEAKIIEKNSLADSSMDSNPDTANDIGCALEDAYFEGLNHYLVQNQMKQSLLNVSTLWLYHLFEQQLNNISSITIINFDHTKKDSVKRIKDCLREKGLEGNSNWKIIHEELRCVANVLKHANGKSKDELEKNRPDLFLSSVSIPLFENEICISQIDFEKYYKAVCDFWADYFFKFPITEKNIKCQG